MIVRFKVRNFKNLKEVDLLFGPFMCIAGLNAVGKSNFFDAIQFLGALARNENTLVDAALSIRNEKLKRKSAQDLRSLFFNDGEKYAEFIDFEVDLIVPESGTDHLGQPATATTTALRYYLSIGFRETEGTTASSPLFIKREALWPIGKREIKKLLKMMGATKEWIDSVNSNSKPKNTPFLETEADIASVSTDQVQGGGKRKLKVDLLPRTILSSTNALENPTMLLAKLEMESWKLIQFEASSLRSPDEMLFAEMPQVSTSGEHLPGTLYRLINDKTISYDVLASLRNRLSELVDDVYEVTVDKDDKRDLLTLMIKGANQVALPARSLSDGTLRFIALSLIEADPKVRGVFCMEEPENGIHPDRIKAILKLLTDIATDITSPIDQENPLRQVIINTHSPLVVSEIMENSLLFAEFSSKKDKSVVFRPLSGTWRTKASPNIPTIRKQDLIKYLSAISSEPSTENYPYSSKPVRERTEIKAFSNQLSIFSHND